MANLPKALPSKEIPFNFKSLGITTKRSYEGTFTVNVPSVRDMSRIGVELSRINDGVPLELLDRSTAALNNALAFLKISLKEAPKWFTDTEQEGGMGHGMDTLDVNVPIEIFKQANELVGNWHKSLQVTDEPESK